jgi:hypothetical protein
LELEDEFRLLQTYQDIIQDGAVTCSIW